MRRGADMLTSNIAFNLITKVFGSLLLALIAIGGIHFSYYSISFHGRKRSDIDQISYNKKRSIKEGGAYICFFIKSNNQRNDYICKRNTDQRMIYNVRMPLRFSLAYFCNFGAGNVVSKVYFEFQTPETAL
jgi:hypothetical protein